MEHHMNLQDGKLHEGSSVLQPIEEKHSHCSRASGTCIHRKTLQHVLLDTIEALEQTKKAFKSKQLEALRKKLTHVMLEHA